MVEQISDIEHLSASVKSSVLAALKQSERKTRPYHYWLVNGVLPEDIVAALQSTAFPVMDLGGVSGTREVHNDSRHYFSPQNLERYSVFDAVARAFQDDETIAYIEAMGKIDLTDSFLRIEYAQDTDGFWLEPHTDIGVKVFTMLLYLSSDENHRDLGTDIYNSDKMPVARSHFIPNHAMVFIPANDTFHGFEKRPIIGVRKSLVINYVTQDWRAREQLCFPDSPIRQAR